MNSTHINTLSNTAASADSNIDNTVDSFEQETGWNFGDALEMAVEARSDARLFGRGKGSSRPRARRSTPKVDLETSIGWGPGAVVDFIAEERREQRLLGRVPLYS
jgi:hypothetical protein